MMTFESDSGGNNRKPLCKSALVVAVLTIGVLAGSFQPAQADSVLLEAPQGSGTYYGMYGASLAASFSLSEASYVSTIDVVLRTPVDTDFVDFAFTLQDSLTGTITTFASAVLTVPRGVVSTRALTVGLILPPGTYYLVGRVPGYAFPVPVTPGNVDGWLLSNGSYNTAAGTITHGVWLADSNVLITTNPTPAFTVHGSVLTARDLLQNLMSAVVTINVQRGISNSFDAKLDAAMRALDDQRLQNDQAVINALYAFINAVEAQRGKELSTSQADWLVSLAGDILAKLI